MFKADPASITGLPNADLQTLLALAPARVASGSSASARVQFSPPQRRPRTQPVIRSVSGDFQRNAAFDGLPKSRIIDRPAPFIRARRLHTENDGDPQHGPAPFCRDRDCAHPRRAWLPRRSRPKERPRNRRSGYAPVCHGPTNRLPPGGESHGRMKKGRDPERQREFASVPCKRRTDAPARQLLRSVSIFVVLNHE